METSKTENVTVTFSMPENVKEFLTCYSQLLKYPSLEAFLKEELQDYYREMVVADRHDYYFQSNVIFEMLRRHGLMEKGEKAK